MYNRWADAAAARASQANADLLAMSGGSRDPHPPPLAGSHAQPGLAHHAALSEAAMLNATASMRQQHAAAAAYGYTGASGLGMSSLGHSGLGGSAASSMASRMLYGATAGEAAMLRQQQSSVSVQEAAMLRQHQAARAQEQSSVSVQEAAMLRQHQAARAQEQSLYNQQQRSAQVLIDRAALAREMEMQSLKQDSTNVQDKRLQSEIARQSIERTKRTIEQQTIEIKDSDSEDSGEKALSTRRNMVEKRSFNESSLVTGPATKKSRKDKINDATQGDVASVRVQQRMKAVASSPANQPVVVIQNWSKERLLDQLVSYDTQRMHQLLTGVLELLTGYTATTAPPGIAFPPKIIELTVPMLNQVIGVVAKDMNKHLCQAIESTFYKCSHFVDEFPKGASLATIRPPVPPPKTVPPPKPVPKPKSVPPPATIPVPHAAAANEKATLTQESDQIIKEKDTIISRQDSRISMLEAEIRKLKETRNNMIGSLKHEQAELKDQVAKSKFIHARSIRAYMRASVESLRGLRESFHLDSDDTDGQEEEQTNE